MSENAFPPGSAMDVTDQMFGRLEGELVEAVAEDGTSSAGLLERRHDGGANVAEVALRPAANVVHSQIAQMPEGGIRLTMRYSDGSEAQLRW